ncbi:MAG: NAD(P)/FAD-dependent oxidoreductase, partial [Bacteroidota bacterium]
HFPRDKVCGDAISGKVLSVLKYLDLDILEEFRGQLFTQDTWGIRFVAPNGQELDIPLRLDPENSLVPAYVAARLDFDHFLVEQVKAAPDLEVMEGFTLRHLDTHEDGFLLSDGSNSFTARLVIGADGANSVVTRKLAQHKVAPKHHSAGVRLYCRPVEGFHPQRYLELHYLPELLPGYFWIFPLPDGRVNVGLGMLTKDLQKQPQNLRSRLLELLATHPRLADRFAKAEAEGPVQGFGLPLGSLRRNISGKGWMLVGDAAGLIDPFTGEGIGNAMISGRLAAQFASAKLRDGQDLKGYDHAVFKKLGAELKLSHQLQKLARYPRLFNAVTRKVNRNESLRTLFTMMFEDLELRRQLSRPSFYGKLFFGDALKKNP